MTTTLNYKEREAIRKLLVGHKIVMVSRDLPSKDQWGDDALYSTLTLDDGTQLEIVPNTGCGGCTSGWMTITQLNIPDNIITNVIFNDIEHDGQYIFQIFVYADFKFVTLMTVEGHDNGYYGVGYEIKVKFPDDSAT